MLAYINYTYINLEGKKEMYKFLSVDRSMPLEDRQLLNIYSSFQFPTGALA